MAIMIAITTQGANMSHNNYIVVNRRCPLCGGGQASWYPKHAANMVCVRCGKSFDASIERHPTDTGYLHCINDRLVKLPSPRPLDGGDG